VKHLRSFSLFEARASRLPSGLTPDQESFLNLYTQGTWSVNPTTGLVDVQGNFNFYRKRLKSLQGISFGHVNGDFYCGNNRLTTLAGAPTTVGGSFNCAYNQLTTLAGAPTTVGRGFYCGSNQLKTLAGAPTKVDGRFHCVDNRLTTLVGAPTTVGGGFYCDYNLLTTLEGAPTTVDGYFYCGNNRLTTLAGAPTTVSGNFSCEENQLTTLEGAPATVNGNFSCHSNQLTTLEGAPTTVDGGFYCDDFSLEPGKWNPVGWAKILATGDGAARRLILTLPVFDADWWLQRLAGDLKKDGQVLLQLAALWEEPSWENQRHEISQRLSSDQLRAIKVLKTKLDYVNPWQDFRF
jgi:hypothetical protein